MIDRDTNFILINEEFPDIGHRIKFLWGYPECRTYFDSLTGDTRDGKRQGFPQHIASAIMWLSLRHDRDFPKLASSQNDIWTNSNWKTL